MVWIFLVLGIALLVVGVLLAVVPTLRADRAHAHAVVPEEAWAVLSQPVVDELISLPKDQPVWSRLTGSKFLQGSIVGAGSSLVVAGVVLSYALVMPGGLSTAEAANPTPKTAESAAVTNPSKTTTDPAQTATPATPATPKPGGTVAFVISSGQVSQEIAFNLKAQSFITSQADFLKRLGERGLEASIQAGEFSIPAGSSLDQVINIITRQ